LAQFDDYWMVQDEDSMNKAIGLVEQATSRAISVYGAQRFGMADCLLESDACFHEFRETGNAYVVLPRDKQCYGLRTNCSEVESRKMRGTLIDLVPTICALASTPVPSDLPNPFALEL